MPYLSLYVICKDNGETPKSIYPTPQFPITTIFVAVSKYNEPIYFILALPSVDAAHASPNGFPNKVDTLALETSITRK